MFEMLLNGALNIFLFALETAFAAGIVFAIYKWVDDQDMEFIDFNVACLFVLIPAVLIFSTANILIWLQLDMNYAFGVYILYFLVPFYWLKSFIDFSTQKSATYAAVVPIAVAIKSMFVLGATVGFTNVLG